MRTEASLLALALLCCSGPPRVRTVEVYQFPADEDAAFCQRFTGPGYPDPESLARDYVTHDGEGTLYGRPNWFGKHHACPGRPGSGWDIVTVVSDARIDSVTVSGPVATAHVTYRQLGHASGSPGAFTEELTNSVHVFKMVHLADGWWLNSNDPPRVLASTILANPNFAMPDSARVRIERLAGMKKSW